MNGTEDVGQLVQMCIVYAFIENNLHPDLNPLIPAVLINQRTTTDEHKGRFTIQRKMMQGLHLCL